MAKNQVIYICLLWFFIFLPSYSMVADDGYCVRITAREYVGVREKGGNNQGLTDKDLQKQMARFGWTKGQPWCAYFVRAVLQGCGVKSTITGWSPTSYNKEDVIYTNGRFYQAWSEEDVLVMSLSYSKFKKTGRYKGIGHTGIVDRIGQYSVRTIEGNTNDSGSRDSRSGDGVYEKIRPLGSNIHITRWKKRN